MKFARDEVFVDIQVLISVSIWKYTTQYLRYCRSKERHVLVLYDAPDACAASNGYAGAAVMLVGAARTRD